MRNRMICLMFIFGCSLLCSAPLVHGDADTLVPLNNSERLAAEMSKAGVTHNLLVIEGAGHGFREPSHRSEASSAMVAWFQAHLTP